MKRAFLLICAIAFTVTGFMSVAHAGTSNLDCTHHAVDIEEAVSDCDDASSENDANAENDHDCCCIHTHIMTGTLSGELPKADAGTVIHTLQDRFHSTDLSSLYRPPIA